MSEVPMPIPGILNEKQNRTASPTTASNKSPQTPQAAAQDYPDGRQPVGAKIVAGAGSRARRIQNGSIGKPYGRKG